MRSDMEHLPDLAALDAVAVQIAEIAQRLVFGAVGVRQLPVFPALDGECSFARELLRHLTLGVLLDVFHAERAWRQDRLNPCIGEHLAHGEHAHFHRGSDGPGGRAGLCQALDGEVQLLSSQGEKRGLGGCNRLHGSWLVSGH